MKSQFINMIIIAFTHVDGLPVVESRIINRKMCQRPTILLSFVDSNTVQFRIALQSLQNA